MNNKIYFRYHLILPFAIIWISISSCSGGKHANSQIAEQDSLTRDSISKANKIDSLSTSLQALDFSKIKRFKYSIDFDTILNKRVFLIHYRILDIQKLKDHYCLKLNVAREEQVQLTLDSTQLDFLRKFDETMHPILIFAITKVKKVDFKVIAEVDDDSDSEDKNDEKTASLDIEPIYGAGHFIINGKLLSIENQ